MSFGAFVEIAPGKEGLVHISKLENHRVEKVEDVVSVGDEIVVMVTEIDQQGRINLSRKDALAKLEAKRLPTHNNQKNEKTGFGRSFLCDESVKKGGEKISKVRKL